MKPGSLHVRFIIAWLSILLFTSFACFQGKLPNNGDSLALPIMVNSAGDTINISSDSFLDDRYILVEFWSSTCIKCRKETAEIQSIAKDYYSKEFKEGKGLSLVTISLDGNSKNWHDYLESNKLIGPYHFRVDSAWNSKPIVESGIRYLPYTFVLNSEGNIIIQGLFGPRLRKKLDYHLK
jgi:thiol-disulfide isomerase/thioredoxin